MADPTIKTFDTLVEGQAAAVQGRAAGLIDYSIGAVLRAVGEATASMGLWLQGLVLVLLRTTRLSTCEDADADTFVADFGAAPTSGDETKFERLPAAFGATNATFSRVSTGGQAVVPVGSSVQTLDGSQKFTVVLDPNNVSYDPAFSGYVMVSGVGSVIVPIRALTAGLAGNALAGAINTIASAIPGVSAVTNPFAVTNGADAETTAQMRVRFRRFVQALRRATPAALEEAVTSIQRGVTCVVKENQHFDGTPEKGFTTIIVDDGSGAPTTGLLTAASLAVDTTRAAGTSYGVYAPTVVHMDVTAGITTVADADHAAAIADVVAALTAFLNTLPIGAPVYWSRVWQVVQDASEDILEVVGPTLNGGTVDVMLTFSQVAKARTLTVT
jgi:uncharacterized phage protein gp47/JayE